MVDWSQLPGIAANGGWRNYAVGAVYVILVLAVIGAVFGDEEDEPGAEAETPAPTEALEAAATDGGTPTATASSTAVPSTPTPTAVPQGTDIAVRIQYDGDWSGALSYTQDGSSNSQSIDGSGTETIDVPDDASVVSVNAQKQDDSSATITVQIVENDTPIQESSTDAEYGVAQVSESFF